jgi:hypothetical protein
VQAAHQELHYPLELSLSVAELEDSEDTASREAFLEAVANGSAVSWQHINLLGEYDFSDEKLQDTVGIKAPKLADQRDTFLGVAKSKKNRTPRPERP